MGQDNTAVQTPAHEQSVKVTSLQALLGARHFKSSVGARWVILTAHQDTGDCANGKRFARLTRERLGIEPVPIRSAMTATSDLAILHLMERVRSAHGTAEVARTWGIGYRQLVAQLSAKRRTTA
ncbi:MAG: hypothetical protein EOP38_20475 [Rubrivivax sp.]|nr:MAG: hypothetical protein EOP38_20475 [Rubrivivax sp.]